MKIKKNLTKDIKMFIKRGDGQILSVVKTDSKLENNSEEIKKEDDELKNKKDLQKDINK